MSRTGWVLSSTSHATAEHWGRKQPDWVWCRLITNGSLLLISVVRLMCILTSYLLQPCANSKHTCPYKKHSAFTLTKAGQSTCSRGSSVSVA